MPLDSFSTCCIPTALLAESIVINLHMCEMILLCCASHRIKMSVF